MITNIALVGSDDHRQAPEKKTGFSKGSDDHRRRGDRMLLIFGCQQRSLAKKITVKHLGWRRRRPSEKMEGFVGGSDDDLRRFEGQRLSIRRLEVHGASSVYGFSRRCVFGPIGLGYFLRYVSGFGSNANS